MRELDARFKRIAAIFDADVAPEVGKETLRTYRAFLLRHFNKETILTGREDFIWEEFYLFGPGDEKEYEELKKSRASYTDEFKLIEIPEETIADHDLIARVRRISDGKKFDIGFSLLTTKKKGNDAYRLLDDFATWICNCQ
jgi:hypothetical protein